MMLTAVLAKAITLLLSMTSIDIILAIYDFIASVYGFIVKAYIEIMIFVYSRRDYADYIDVIENSEKKDTIRYKILDAYVSCSTERYSESYYINSRPVTKQLSYMIDNEIIKVNDIKEVLSYVISDNHLTMWLHVTYKDNETYDIYDVSIDLDTSQFVYAKITPIINKSNDDNYYRTNEDKKLMFGSIMSIFNLDDDDYQ